MEKKRTTHLEKVTKENLHIFFVSVFHFVFDGSSTLDPLLSQARHLLDQEVMKCVSSPPYFRGLQKFLTSKQSWSNRRFEASQDLYHGMMTMIMTDQEKYAGDKWSRHMDDLKQFEEQVNLFKQEYTLQHGLTRIRQPLNRDLIWMYPRALLAQRRLSNLLARVAVQTGSMMMRVSSYACGSPRRNC